MIDVGTHITNIISDGEGESDLYLTFTFSWNFPEIKAGSDIETQKRKQFSEQAKEAVLMSITEIRELVQKGVLKV